MHEWQSPKNPAFNQSSITCKILKLNSNYIVQVNYKGNKIFNTEVKSISMYQRHHIVELLSHNYLDGYS